MVRAGCPQWTCVPFASGHWQFDPLTLKFKFLSQGPGGPGVRAVSKLKPA